MLFYVYIIESLKDQSYYIGCTKNVEERLEQHNQGLSKYTSKKFPWKLVYYEILPDRKSAREREYFLKRQRNRNFYKRLIQKSK